MSSEITLLTRTIQAEVAGVGLFARVRSHMSSEITLLTRTIRAEVARVVHLFPLLPLRLATTLPLPLHPAWVLASLY